MTTNGGRQPSNTGDFQASNPSHFHVKKKRVSQTLHVFRKDSKLPFSCNNASTEFFANQKPSAKEMEGENSNASPVECYLKDGDSIQQTPSIFSLLQLQCYWSTSISMHKSCTSSYVLGDSPIQKYIFDAACQVSASNIWVT